MAVCFGVGIMAGCKEKVPELIPSVQVNITLPLNLPEFNDLTVPGNAFTVQREGYLQHGIYVVHEAINPGTFSAYDATCPRHLDSPTSTRREGTSATCPHCDTAYELLNNALSADGNFRLQPYKVDNHSGTLHVHNP